MPDTDLYLKTLNDLKRPLKPDEIEWRIQQIGMKEGKPWAIVVPYLDARAAMKRLDEVLGFNNWNDEYRPISQRSISKDGKERIENGFICRITVTMWDKDGDLAGTFFKEDAASSTDIESIKGGVSDAFKRACVKLGIGRYLYYLPTPMFAKVGEHGLYYQKETEKHATFRWSPPDLPEWALPK